MASILAIDYGEKRIGLALASREARLASPYQTLPNDEHFQEHLRGLIEKEGVERLLVGLPRSLEGNDTPQTTEARQFAATLEKLGLPVELRDEALTSVKAREELEARRKPYKKGDIDALAATYILEDYLREL